MNTLKKNAPSDYIKFFEFVGKSKLLLRTGWIREKIKNPESVAEHSFRVGIMAMTLADKLGYPLNVERLMVMALLHDLGEVITGDVVTERWDIIDIKKRRQKELEEREGIKKIFSEIGEEYKYLAIFDEMIARRSPEAKVFWQLDKLEMAMQALEYELSQGKNLDEFFLGVDLYHVHDPLIKDIFQEMIKKRPKKRI